MSEHSIKGLNPNPMSNLFINEIFCPNPMQQDENFIFTVQERYMNV